MKYLCVLVALFILTLVGCGESTKEKMLRMAQQRAERNKAAEERTSQTPARAQPATEDSNGSGQGGSDQSVTQASTPSSNRDSSKGTMSSAPVAEAEKDNTTEDLVAREPTHSESDTTLPDSSGGARGSSTAAGAVASEMPSAAIPPPSTSKVATPAAESNVATSGRSELPKRNQKTWLSPDGRYVATIEADGSITVVFTENEDRARAFHTSNLQPATVAFSATDILFVATQSGAIKSFDLTSIDDIDDFSRQRRLSDDAKAPRQLHDHPISAIAVGENYGISGDTDGQLRIWQLTPPDPRTLGGLASPPRLFQCMQNGRVIFAACEDGSINYWLSATDAPVTSMVRPFLKLDGKPVVMRSMPGGKGLAVADDRGTLALSWPTSEGVTNSTHQLAKSAFVGMAFDREGRSLVYATRSGSVIEQPLPLPAVERAVFEAEQGMLGFDYAPESQLCAFVDGSAELSLLKLGEQELQAVIRVQDSQLTHLAIAPDGDRIVAGGQSLSGNPFVALCSPAQQSVTRTIRLDAPLRYLAFSADGKRIGCTTLDGGISIFSSEGLMLEKLPAGTCSSSFTFSQDASEIVFGRTDSNSPNLKTIVHPLMAFDSLQVSDSEIIELASVPTLSAFLCATGQGTSFFNPKTLELFPLPDSEATVLDACVSPDGRFLAVMSGQTDGNQVNIRKLPTDVPNDVKVDQLTFHSPRSIGGASVTAMAFAADSNHLLLGQNDGTIGAWNVSSGLEDARFVDHEGAVEQIAPLRVNSQFISFANDNTLRSWDFPITLNAPGQPATSSESTNTIPIQAAIRSRIPAETVSDDPLDVVRVDLFSSANEKEAMKRFFDQIEGEPGLRKAARDDYFALVSAEDAVFSETTTPATLAAARKKYYRSRNQLLPRSTPGQSTSFADNQANLLARYETDFDFGLVGNKPGSRRPVQLRLSDKRFLYAARASEPIRDQEDLDITNEPGRIMGWDFGFSGMQVCSWSPSELSVDGIYAAGNSRGVFTGPDLRYFPISGRSQRIAAGGVSWALSPAINRGLLALGKAGPTDAEGAVLETYQTEALAKGIRKPLGSLAAFDGMVTAVAFANQHSRIAFSIRDRTTTKVFIANPSALLGSSLKLVFEHSHLQPFRRAAGSIAGVDSLAFSPNDDVLVAHGQFETPEPKDDEESGDSEFRFKGWLIEWLDADIEKTSEAFEDFTSNKPLIDAGSKLSLRFMQGVDFSIERYLRLVSQNARRSRNLKSNSAGDLRVVFESGGKATVYSLLRSEVITTVDLTDPQRGEAAYSITEDGRWLIVGTGRGAVRIWDLLKDKNYSLTLDERPAHTGPIVGVTLSNTNPKLGIPEFAATAGEENQVKVWDVISVLETELQTSLR